MDALIISLVDAFSSPKAILFLMVSLNRKTSCGTYPIDFRNVSKGMFLMFIPSIIISPSVTSNAAVLTVLPTPVAPP